MSYSQFGEDRIMSKYFNDEYKGVCVEVGAADGISGSNTYYFENKGWKTLCIEPIPEAFNKCNSIRKHSLNYGVSNYNNDNMDFFVVCLNGDNTSAISSLQVDERLINSHASLISNIEKISVEVRTLDYIFNEIDFPKDIDFISIDTENTEFDVLKGLDLNIYNVKFFIIENNFEDPHIEQYLITQKFTKFFRNAVNDFYVNNKYLNEPFFDIYNIKHANYYILEDEKIGDVTTITKILFKRFELSLNKDFNLIVSNDLFPDSAVFSAKRLFLTIQNSITQQMYNFIFNESEILDFNLICNEITAVKPDNYFIETSIGEIIDKYSILELKTKYITDQKKLDNIKKEMNVLQKYKDNINHTYFYKLLLHINELIWLDTDLIKTLSLDNKDYQNIQLFAETSNKIFENNQKRFRLKNYFNILEKSTIKEHKSYQNNACFIEIHDETTIYNKLSEINYICISHDLIYLDIKYKDLFTKIFINPNIDFIETNIDFIETNNDFIETNNNNNNNNNNNFTTIYNLQSFKIDSNLINIYEFDPISYNSGGLFGDFLNQLSVVAEKFYDTGRKGLLYISNEGEAFRNGLDVTYNDTYNIISKLFYIKEYNIFNNQNIDINLSKWRNYHCLENNLQQILHSNYKISWAKHQWLFSNIDQTWTNKILINISPYRTFTYNSLYLFIKAVRPILSDCVFVSNEKEWYEDFVNKTGLNINYYQTTSFEETLTIVNSCKMGYFGYSSMAVIANALHKKHILLSNGVFLDYKLNNLKGVIPHILDILN